MVGKEPNRYIVRVWMDSSAPLELRPWAFSADDAMAQVNLELSKSSPKRGIITYVGPVNPKCECLGGCRCGTLERREIRGICQDCKQPVPDGFYTCGGSGSHSSVA